MPDRAQEYIMNDWIRNRRLLWDDDEHVLIVDNVKHTGPMKLAGKVTIQSQDQYCCGNPFRPNTTRRKDNVKRYHTWCIEFDDRPIDEQRELWAGSDMPHTMRVFSGNKSIHVYIRSEEDVDADTWQDIANALGRIYSDADKKVLSDRARLTRLPGGLRGDIVQKVEATFSRIPLKSLCEWIGRNDVTKVLSDKEIKGLSNKVKYKDEHPPDDRANKIRAMRFARESYSEQDPERFQLYERLVACRFKAERDKRNERIVELITFLHDAVCEDVAFDFAAQFYYFNSMCFTDSIEQHMREARSHWKRLEEEYPSRLCGEEYEIYLAIDEREKVFFRICRSMAFREGAEMRLDIPMGHFGHRMGIAAPQVSRLIEKFKMYVLLNLIKPGTQHKQNKDGSLSTGSAGVYEWLMPMQEVAV
jgi:hypothetical protein